MLHGPFVDLHLILRCPMTRCWLCLLGFVNHCSLQTCVRIQCIKSNRKQVKLPASAYFIQLHVACTCIIMEIDIFHILYSNGRMQLCMWKSECRPALILLYYPAVPTNPLCSLFWNSAVTAVTVNVHSKVRELIVNKMFSVGSCKVTSPLFSCGSFLPTQ